MKQNRIVLAGALAIATFATVAVAAPNDRPGGGTPPAPHDDESYPPSCNSAAQVTKVVCPPTIAYNETTSAAPTGGPPWSSTTATKTAAFTNAVVGGATNKTVSCLYTADGTDRLSIVQTSPKACAMSKKFRGANCCS